MRTSIRSKQKDENKMDQMLRILEILTSDVHDLKVEQHECAKEIKKLHMEI